jgi:hypothetical protein
MIDDLVEAAAIAARDADGCGLTLNGKLSFCDEEGGDREKGDCACRRAGAAVLAAILPAIRAGVIEECAKHLEDASDRAKATILDNMHRTKPQVTMNPVRRGAIERWMEDCVQVEQKYRGAATSIRSLAEKET